MNQPVPEPVFETLLNRLSDRTATVGVIGLGYVGLPLAAACARAGFKVTGFDIDEAKTTALGKGLSYIDAVASEELAGHVSARRFEATSDFAHLKHCDAVVICVPTPLSKHREPDLSYVSGTAEQIADRLRPGHLIVLESTTYPGTTLEVLKPILEAGGLRSGADFWLGFSPEREDPGNDRYHTASIPKVVAGDGEQASDLMKALYGAVVDTVVPVSTPSVAEAVKITENVFRAVNIALVNELKVIYDAMGIDVWEVIDAASTKPFGFMPFYPGPGLGGHCIPIDPFYLTWKSREYGLPTRFIELAGEINVAMPKYVVGRLRDELDQQQSVALGAAAILVLGLAYKKNVSDIRESPSFALIELLEKHGCKVEFHDPHVGEIPMTREHADLAGRKSSDLTAEAVAQYNAVLVSTDHDAIDYQLVANSAKLIVDARNAFARRGLAGAHIVKA
ncbi:nucleotide sugar dehydrogenase [Anderseniella sp. Alg231-50]|uniref:nucleotide sugar dehydrogenase n=1 Tax=Anderseniella sp. Alg231-50 TaxID=1922226 RepID=UPI000D556E73